MAARKGQKPGWSRLDNAALLYSAIQREDYSAVYRFSAVMDRPVEPAALQRAIDRTMPRSLSGLPGPDQAGGVLVLF